MRVILEQCGSLERGKRLAAARGVPDVAVAGVVLDALHHLLHGIDLIRSHDDQLLLRLHQHHVAADQLAQSALVEHFTGKLVQVSHLLVLLIGPPTDGQELLLLVERERLLGVVGEVERIGLVADNEELHEGQQCMLVAVRAVVLVVHDLLDGHTWRHPMRLQLHLHQR